MNVIAMTATAAPAAISGSVFVFVFQAMRPWYPSVRPLRVGFRDGSVHREIVQRNA